MDPAQERFEQAVGDDFIAWYNAANGTALASAGRAGRAPDLAYRDGPNELLVEVAAAYYNAGAAAFRWKNLRGSADAPEQWSGWNFTEALLTSLNRVLEAKSVKAYEPNCVLVVDVNAPLATAERIEAILPAVRVPSTHRFLGIYISGNFGHTVESTGGYRCWKLA